MATFMIPFLEIEIIKLLINKALQLGNRRASVPSVYVIGNQACIVCFRTSIILIDPNTTRIIPYRIIFQNLLQSRIVSCQILFPLYFIFVRYVINTPLALFLQLKIRREDSNKPGTFLFSSNFKIHTLMSLPRKSAKSKTKTKFFKDRITLLF